MRQIQFGVLVLVLSGCSTYREHRERQNIVNETYIHKYGLEVPQEDWSSRGEHGTVVTDLVNGVKVCRNYSSGKLDGEATYTFPHSDKIEKSQIYSQGELVSEKNFYTSGIPSKEIKNLSPTSVEITTWYESGIPRSLERYEDDFLALGEYYTLNNQVDARVSDLEGSRISRDKWGQLISRDTIKDGQMVLQKTYHPNSSPKELIPYVNGQIEGKKRTFHPTGEPEAIETWNAGVQEGKTLVYENGEVISEITFQDGRKNGVERRFQDGTKVVEEITWKKDRKHGPSYTYLGGRTQVDWYHEGKRVNKNQYENLNR